MDAKALIVAVSEVADNKGLSGEAVIQALELALEKAYIKVLGGSTPDLPDPVVKCVIDPDTGKIYLAQVKKVVEEVTDDFLEIDEEEANEGLKKAKYHVGDDYEIEADVEDLSKATAMGVKSSVRESPRPNVPNSIRFIKTISAKWSREPSRKRTIAASSSTLAARPLNSTARN